MSQNKKRKPRSNAAVMKRQVLQETMYKNVLGAEMNRVYNKGKNDGNGIALLIIMWLLHTEFGFGKKRLTLFVKTIGDFCTDFVAPGEDGPVKVKDGEFNGISLKEIAEQLEAETGVHFDIDNWTMTVPDTEIIKKEAD